MRRPNHASRFEGIAKTKLQASRASDTETLQSQVTKAGKKRLSLSGLEVLHGRLSTSEGLARAGCWHNPLRGSTQATTPTLSQRGRLEFGPSRPAAARSRASRLRRSRREVAWSGAPAVR